MTQTREDLLLTLFRGINRILPWQLTQILKSEWLVYTLHKTHYIKDF
jgi:hypothetical protein